MKEINLAKEILIRGRVGLLCHYPFFGELSLRLRLIPSKMIPSTAVDYKDHLFYNEDWVSNNFNETKKPMTVVEIAHELGHLIFRHNVRIPSGAIPSIWNLACDQIIDTTLVQSGLKQSSVSAKMVTEEIQKQCKFSDGKIKNSELRYVELLKEMKKCPECAKLIEAVKNAMAGNSSSSDKGNHSENCNHDKEDESPDKSDNVEPSEQSGIHICKNIRLCCSGSIGQDASEEDNQKWKEYIVAAAKNAKEKGNLPSFAKDFLAELSQPSRNWKDIIRSQASMVYRGRYTYKKNNRRSWSMNVQLPGKYPKPEPAIVALDCSGSIGEKLLNRFVSEVFGILKVSGASEIIVILHDVNVYYVGEHSKSNIRQLKASWGGTSHIDVFNKIKEMKKKPGMLICFTDLESDQMKLHSPKFPVIWCYPSSAKNTLIPFGRKVEVPDV